jgi:hypothetical protein
MKYHTGKLTVETFALASFTRDQWDEIWRFSSQYIEATRDAYEASIRQKSEIVLIRERDVLVGLGAVDLYSLSHEGTPSWIIFVGNTIFAEGYRGHNIVEKTGFLYFLWLRLRHPTHRIYLAYGTFSYKTFLMLSRNFVEYWPHPTQETPEREATLIDHLARRYYGDAWEPARQVMRASAVYNLKGWVAAIDESRKKDPHIQFFLQKNPNYQQGESVFCLVPLHASNWFSVFRSVVTHALQ